MSPSHMTNAGAAGAEGVNLNHGGERRRSAGRGGDESGSAMVGVYPATASPSLKGWPYLCGSNARF